MFSWLGLSSTTNPRALWGVYKGFIDGKNWILSVKLVLLYCCKCYYRLWCQYVQSIPQGMPQWIWHIDIYFDRSSLIKIHLSNIYCLAFVWQKTQLTVVVTTTTVMLPSKTKQLRAPHLCTCNETISTIWQSMTKANSQKKTDIRFAQREVQQLKQ